MLLVAWILQAVTFVSFHRCKPFHAVSLTRLQMNFLVSFTGILLVLISKPYHIPVDSISKCYLSCSWDWFEVPHSSPYHYFEYIYAGNNYFQ